MNKVTLNICKKIFVHLISFLLGRYLGEKLLGHIVMVCVRVGNFQREGRVKGRAGVGGSLPVQ